jgi:hypothetical protein
MYKDPRAAPGYAFRVFTLLLTGSLRRVSDIKRNSLMLIGLAIIVRI